MFVHCGSYLLLQLTLVKTINSVCELKILTAMNALFSLFSHSLLNLYVRCQTEKAVDGMGHKLVQPGTTRWLSFEGNITVVPKHCAAISISLDTIYNESGTKSCETGGATSYTLKERHLTVSACPEVFLTAFGPFDQNIAVLQLQHCNSHGIREGYCNCTTRWLQPGIH